eukprot:m.62250 g.62250  ORF g.62250 m.62250 type:complete len:90 (-) comp11498_c0_seq8:967-1236(-)
MASTVAGTRTEEVKEVTSNWNIWNHMVERANNFEMDIFPESLGNREVDHCNYCTHSVLLRITPAHIYDNLSDILLVFGSSHGHGFSGFF